MISRIKKNLFSYKQTPIILGFLVLIAYGLTVTMQGFFMDDWYIIWYKHLFGAIHFPEYFSVDRPLMGYFYVLANFLLGNSESALVWQLFALFMRWLCVYTLWEFLNALWPNAKKQNNMVVLLAAVFPGFIQQWIAIIYSFFFFCLACFFLSLTLMIKAIKNPSRFWLFITLSLITGFYSYAAAEFYFGLELIRPIVLWIHYSRESLPTKKRIRQSMLVWLPFLFIYIIYGVWRAFFFESIHHDVMVTGQLTQSLFRVFVDLVRKIYQAGVDSVVNAWSNPLNLGNYPTNGFIPVAILVLVSIVFISLVIWLGVTSKNDQSEKQYVDLWKKEAFWLAIVSLVVAVIPFWAADLPIDYNYPYDRFLLAYLFGSCLLLVVLIDQKRIGTLLVAFLIAVSCGYQFNTSIRYKNSWDQQKDFFWQLTWRIPDLKDNTILVAEDLPFSDYFSGTSLTAPLNLIYAPELESHQIPYLFLLNKYQDDDIKSYQNENRIDYNFRSFEFSADSAALLLLDKRSDGCLRIVLPSDLPQEFEKSDTTGFWQSTISLSNIDRIITDPINPVLPAEKFFGKENQNQWCYYFEKADLARQQQQWSDVIQNYETASEAGFRPQVDSEWVPLVDAYLHVGNIEQAISVTKYTTNHDQTNTAALCRLWTDAKDYENVLPFAEEILTWLNCRVLHEE